MPTKASTLNNKNCHLNWQNTVWMTNEKWNNQKWQVNIIPFFLAHESYRSHSLIFAFIKISFERHRELTQWNVCLTLVRSWVGLGLSGSTTALGEAPWKMERVALWCPPPTWNKKNDKVSAAVIEWNCMPPERGRVLLPISKDKTCSSINYNSLEFWDLSMYQRSLAHTPNENKHKQEGYFTSTPSIQKWEGPKLNPRKSSRESLGKIPIDFACRAQDRAGYHRLPTLRTYWENTCRCICFAVCATPLQVQHTRKLKFCGLCLSSPLHPFLPPISLFLAYSLLPSEKVSPNQWRSSDSKRENSQRAASETQNTNLIVKLSQMLWRQRASRSSNV